MKPKVYIETTIPSYVTALPAKNVIIAGKQETSRQWWEEKKEHFELFISPFVIEEAEKGDADMSALRIGLINDVPILAVDDTVTDIARAILAKNIIPEKAATDASHIAIATRHGMDFLLTWNCTHIANAQILRFIRKEVENFGYELPIICTPDELMGDEND